MKKNEISAKLRSYVRENLSPTQKDIEFVASIYQSFNDLLGTKNCIQIGSYPRYTAIRPLHDLDILYIIGNWTDLKEIPDSLLSDLAKGFKENYVNPTEYTIDVSVQTHSVSFKYMDGDEEVFAVDLVPSLVDAKNEFDLDTYYVPEIVKYQRGQKRAKFYNEITASSGEIDWIKTDPRGYIEVAKNLNNANTDFRKSVKFVKGWKNFCREKNDNFKLKSFHLEQLITLDYLEDSSLDIFDSVFKLFVNLKDNIKSPRIKDRADNDRYIDQYVNELTESEIELIHQAVDAILIAFEGIETSTEIDTITDSGFYQRTGDSEEFLFDQQIPMLTDDSLDFKIDGQIKKFDGFREFIASLKKTIGVVDTKNKINFRVVRDDTGSELVKWKVQNDKSSEQPRGEITDHRTLRSPESTAYIGGHFVECYAIKNSVCIAKDRVGVIVKK